MIKNFETYFDVPKDKPVYKHSQDPEAVKNRLDKANEQSRKPCVPYSEVYAYINEFLEECRNKNGYKKANHQVDTINLEDIKIVLDNGIIAKGCTWIKNIWNKKTGKYTQYDMKYMDIKEKFNLSHSKDILWFKFTRDGYLGVVAKGQDINFDDQKFSGKCVKHVQKEWDKSFVFIFPITNDIRGNKEVGEIENAVGNYLIAKGVPIIDFYSHNY